MALDKNSIKIFKYDYFMEPSREQQCTENFADQTNKNYNLPSFNMNSCNGKSLLIYRRTVVQLTVRMFSYKRIN